MNIPELSKDEDRPASPYKRKCESQPDKPNKLPRLPITHKVTKRPLIHPSIPSPYASSSSQKVVYISQKTPFMSAVNRVRHLLKYVEKRDSQATLASVENNHRQARRQGGRKGDGGGDKILATAMAATERRQELARKGGGEEVVIKGTGRAIEKVLGLAEFFRQNAGKEGVEVVLRTGSVWAVDDVVPRTDEEVARVRARQSSQRGRGAGSNKDKEEDEEMEGVIGEGENAAVPPDIGDVPESRLRQTSVLEVGVSLC